MSLLHMSQKIGSRKLLQLLLGGILGLRFWPFLTTNLPWVDICKGIHYRWHFMYHLPTLSCQHSLWTPLVLLQNNEQNMTMTIAFLKLWRKITHLNQGWQGHLPEHFNIWLTQPIVKNPLPMYTAVLPCRIFFLIFDKMLNWRDFLNFSSIF